MISYNDIYEASRKERYADQLQPLPKHFLPNVSEYLREKRVMAKEEDEFSGDALRIKKQIENANTLFRELLLRRRKKIFHLVLIASETGISKQDFQNMLQFEKELFEEAMKAVESSERKFREALKGQPGDVSITQHELLVFKEPVEEFLDTEENKVGPFDTGQIANISKDVAKVLIDSGKAEILHL